MLKESLGLLVRLSLVLTAMLTIAACLDQRSRHHSSELILFAIISASPFHDSIFTAELDGSSVDQLFIPGDRRSYVYASGNSLRDGLVVTVHEANSSGKVANHNFWYRRVTNQWRRLFTQDGMEGAGYLSLDGSRIICLFNPESEPTAQLHPWIINLASWETKRLTNEARVGGWDGSVSWHPNGQEIVFVRLERTADTISSTLMQVSLSTGIPVQLFGPDVGVMAACYAADGMQMALLTSKGLEIAKTTDMERSLVLPWSSLPNAQFRAGGLVWARDHNLISFAIFNKQTKRYEIWIVSPDGSSAKVIYSQNESEGRIGVTAIIRT